MRGIEMVGRMIQFHIALEIVTVISKMCDQEISTGL